MSKCKKHIIIFLTIFLILLFIINIVLFGLVVKQGGLYISDYFESGDLINIENEILSSGNDDVIFLFLSHFILILTLPMIYMKKNIFFFCGVFLSIKILFCMETGSFIDIAKSTLYYSPNKAFMYWIMVYVTILIVMFTIKIINSNR